MLLPYFTSRGISVAGSPPRAEQVLKHVGWAKFLRLSSVRTFENLLKALQHLFVIFFDDMIEQTEVTQKSHVRLLCYGILWTVSEEAELFGVERRHRAWRLLSRGELFKFRRVSEPLIDLVEYGKRGHTARGVLYFRLPQSAALFETLCSQEDTLCCIALKQVTTTSNPIQIRLERN